MTTAEAVRAPTPALRRLARLYGVQTFYQTGGPRQNASVDGLLAVLTALGAPLAREGDARDAVTARRRELWGRIVEPVAVAWDSRPPALELRLPESAAGPVNLELVLENGEPRHWAAAIDSLPLERAETVGGEPFVARSLKLPRRRLPAGYHRLTVRHGRRSAGCLVISAPSRAYTGEPGEPRGWGAFLPLYALRTESDWGAGDLSSLGALIDWTAGVGGSTVSTLPLFAAFLGEPFEPSPYSPASRLFWNEFYLDPTTAPEFAACDEACRIAASPAFAAELHALRCGEYVDYGRVMALKRRVLDELAYACFESHDRRRELRRFAREYPAADDYARFRAVVECRRQAWPDWPEKLREGTIEDGDFDEHARRYHLYVQLLAHEQLSALRQRSEAAGVRLNFDLPLGVDAAGYDVWRERDSFALGLHAGAPPDAIFAGGQDWGFPPPHPDNIRLQGYRYLRSVIGGVLRFAGVLRIDHVMGLHHLYCVPAGMGAKEGVYVRYRPDELYAILSLESHRGRALIVGEDLGTVPRYVPAAMARHAIYRTYVTQYEASPDKPEPLPRPHARSFAGLNTHDMPPFAAYWTGPAGDAEAQEWARRTRAAIVRSLRRRGARISRDPGAREALRALLVDLGRSRARTVLVNLEDIWGETRPQNMPGTADGGNWVRKARCTLEEMKQRPDVVGLLRELHESRQTPAGAVGAVGAVGASGTRPGTRPHARPRNRSRRVEGG